jgi:F-type H+-transporting ATPase subunit b
MGDLGISGWKLIVQIVAFLIFVYLMWRLALGPIVATLDKRQLKIRESMEAAQRMQTELQATAARNEEVLAEARREAQAILTTARETGEATLARYQEEASKQADEYLTRAKATLSAETEQARLQLRQEVANLAVNAATKIVRKELDPAAQTRLIEETLSEAAGRAGGAGPVA